MSNWKDICGLDDIPRQGSRVVRRDGGDIAVFRTATDEIFAVRDKCPHRSGPLSQGIVTGKVVTCPMHSWKIDLATGEAVAPDQGCARTLATRVETGRVWLALE